MTDQADLFHDPDPAQEAYAAALQAQWQADLSTIMEQGRIPTWVELDSVLQKDEYRLLDLIEEHGGYLERGEVTREYGTDNTGLFPVPVIRHVDQLTDDAGFVAAGNALAVVNRCLANGWIERSYDQVERCSRLDLTRMGRWAKDLCETDMYWENMTDD